MVLEKKLSSDIVVSTLINLSQKVRGLVFIPVITKSLGTASYGAFTQLLVISTLFATFSRLGFERALIRYAQERNTADRGSLYISLTFAALGLSSLFATIVFALAAPFSELFLGSDRYTELFRIGSLLIPIYASQVMAQNWYRVDMNVKLYSVLEGVKTYINVFTVIFVVFVAGWGLRGLIIAIVAVEALFAVVIQMTVIRATGIHQPTISGFNTYLRYSIPISVTDLLGMFQDRIDRLLIGFFLGANFVGIYSVAYSVAKLLRMYILPLRLTFFPEFSRLWMEGNQADCYRFLSNGSRYLIGLAIPSIVGLYLIGNQLLELLSTGKIAGQAVLLLPIIALGILFIGLETLYRQLFYAAEETKLVSIIRIISVAANILFNIVLIPIYGIIGAALATLIANLFAFVMIYSLSRRRYQINFEKVFTIKSSLAAMIMYSIAILSGYQNIFLLVIISVFVYALVLILSRGIRIDEILFLIHSVKSTFTR
ncbi:lipopolysaccharide biosynthesis protein [Natrialba aegyptia]|uniref:lipopolysaccharide biosynthesis protein n=1 Tax=Natrialba aegyptia TaxID=129789 RepID=UPI000A071947|nr:oligosaccharide flippase family protein [Natrialba aegyptia]